MIVGGFEIKGGGLRGPSISVSSSSTIDTTCCTGFRACETSSARALSRTRAVKLFDDVSETSASRSARRDFADRTVNI